MKTIDHLAIVFQDPDKSVRLMPEGSGLTARSVKQYPDSGMRAAVMKVDNLDVELIEPTGPGIYWQFRPLGPAGFNHLAFDSDSIASFEDKRAKLGIMARENSTRNATGGSITDLAPETTLGLRIQMFKRR